VSTEAQAQTLDRLSGIQIIELQREVASARKKFPGNRFLLTALMEEVGELAQAILQKNPGWRKEALQCACVAMRIFAEGDPAYNDLTEDEAKS
jgi:NTP pyrophosphatase (non-canonical NTP hydrolase)